MFAHLELKQVTTGNAYIVWINDCNILLYTLSNNMCYEQPTLYDQQYYFAYRQYAVWMIILEGMV